MAIPKYKNGNLKTSRRTRHLKQLSGLKFMSRVSFNNVLPSGDCMQIKDQVNADDDVVTDDNVSRCPWLSERRVIEFSVLLEGLRKCRECPNSLQINNIIKETVMGLGSLFHIECEKCKCINIVASGKRHSSSTIDNTGDSGKSQNRTNVFDVNTKLAAAMVNAGIGECQMNNVLAYINLPTITHRTLKKREREIGSSITAVAKDSCIDAIKEEIMLLEEVNRERSNDNQMKPEFTADGGWNQRGSGHNYNSQSGHVTILGKLSKKCLDYGNANKACRFCKVAKAAGRAPTVHKCVHNFSGSSKAMEPFLTVQCLEKVKSSGLTVGTFTMDDDTSTFARAIKSGFLDLEKSSNRNHVIKNFTSGLYKLRESNKCLTVAIINYLRKCFSYATAQNIGKPSGIRNNILAIVPHVYGDHSKCGNWCKQAEVQNYKHSYKYMGGKDLNNQSLRVALDSYFERYTTDDMTRKLASLGSTNGNENMNSMISRKAPKSINYSESEGLESRISAAIVKKNKSHQYILDVNKVHCLSPGKSTTKRCRSLDIRRRRKAERAATVQQKRRRLQLKDERLHVNRVREVEEGTTYASGVSHIYETDANEVPSALDKPKPACVHYSLKDLVVFDLETTGGGNNDSILQISARHFETDTCFSRYVIPTSGYINHHITTLTGLEYHGKNMYHNAHVVKACEVSAALNDFSKWIDGLDTTEPVLVAHNASFDGRMLNNAFRRCSTSSHVTRYADTLPYFKIKYPGRTGKGVYTLSSLAREYLPGKEFSFHDADEDVRSLTELLMSSNISEQDLQCHLTSVQELEYKRLLNANKMTNIATYNVAVKKKAMSIIVSEKLAESGLRLDHLKMVAERSGAHGVKTLLKSRCGQCRFDVEVIMSVL